jgi:hypothetical protein
VPIRTPDPHGLIVAKIRVDYRAGALVHLACGDPEVARSGPARKVAERVCARLLDRLVGYRDPEDGARWVREDPTCAGWIFEAAMGVGGTLYVRGAGRCETLQGRVEARTDPSGTIGALIALGTQAPPERVMPMTRELCLRLLAGEPLARVAARLRRLEPGADLVAHCRLQVGT